jgi:hypothetical protein
MVPKKSSGLFGSLPPNQLAQVTRGVPSLALDTPWICPMSST